MNFMPSLIERYGEREFFNRQAIVREYLTHGSVDAAQRANNYSLPYSNASFHRILDEFGVIKSVGPNCLLSEAIGFVNCLTHNKIPLERLYKKLPYSIQTSMVTMHRIAACVKEGVVRRAGTALVISPQSDLNKVLIASDQSGERLIDHQMGKFFGALTIPMTYSKFDEDPQIAINRVLQYEVFSQEVLDQVFPFDIAINYEHVINMRIADISIRVFRLIVDDDLDFSSFKLSNHHFDFVQNISSSENGVFRAGVRELISKLYGFEYEESENLALEFVY